MKKNILIIIFIFMNIMCLNASLFYCNAESSTKIDDIIDEGDSFIARGKSAEQRDGTPIDTFKGNIFSSTVRNVYKILLAIAIASSVIVAGIMGIQIIVGSAEEKAQVQERIVPFIIGNVVVFGAFSIWQIAMILAGNL